MDSIRSLPLYIVEAFTIGANQPFSGNTAGVCVLEFDDDITDELKQNIAMQMAYSETAFVARSWSKSKSAPYDSTSTNQWTLRWFTPNIEIDLCGYATLATAHVIFNQILKKCGHVDADAAGTIKETTITFDTKWKGELGATIDWSTGSIALDFPTNVPVPLTSVSGCGSEFWVDKLIAAIVGRSLSPTLVDDVQLVPGINFILMRLKNTGDPEKNQALLTQVEPYFQDIVTLLGSLIPKPLKLHATVLTIQGWSDRSAEVGQGHGRQCRRNKPQFFSRIFGPSIGINEDPVCGSAHTILTPYWIHEYQKQGIDFSTKEIIGLQLSARKGEFLCSMQDGGGRVKMVGQSRLTFSGEFYLESTAA